MSLLKLFDFLRSLEHLGTDEVIDELKAWQNRPLGEVYPILYLDAWRQWDEKFPTIAKSWRTNWSRVIPFFAHPPKIRHAGGELESRAQSLLFKT